MIIKIKKMMCLFTACLILGSCATKSSQILPLPYANTPSLKRLDCNTLKLRLEDKKNDLALLVKVQDRRARKDSSRVTGFLVGSLFVPLLWIGALFPKGDDETANRIARLKGEILVIEGHMEFNC